MKNFINSKTSPTNKQSTGGKTYRKKYNKNRTRKSKI